MWQRIQTLYLILIIGLMIAAALLPAAELFNHKQNLSYQLDSRGIIQLDEEGSVVKSISTNPSTYVFGIVLFLTTFCIFNFKNRRKQMRFATINLVVIVIYIVVEGVLLYYASNKLGAKVTLLYPAAFPLVALILNYLAMRGIAKDEKIVRSLDRLR